MGFRIPRSTHFFISEEKEEEKFIQNHTRARRDSERDGTNTLSRNADFNQSADEIGKGGGGGGVYSESYTREEEFIFTVGPTTAPL